MFFVFWLSCVTTPDSKEMGRFWDSTWQQRDGKVLGQHLTAKKWEGFGTAPDSKEMGTEMGYGRGVGTIYIYIYMHIFLFVCVCVYAYIFTFSMSRASSYM